MPRLPNQSLPKKVPEDTLQHIEEPAESKLKQTQPENSDLLEDTPTESKKVEVIPEESKQLEETPEESPPKTEMPSDLNEENCVVIGDKKIEIKPTKLKYFRNKASSGYGYIKSIPLHEFLTYEAGAFDAKRSADQLLFDFLISVFDNSSFVRDNYDNLDADIIDKICKIFGRINHIDEKEEQLRKNREAQAQNR